MAQLLLSRVNCHIRLEWWWSTKTINDSNGPLCHRLRSTDQTSKILSQCLSIWEDAALRCLRCIDGKLYGSLCLLHDLERWLNGSRVAAHILHHFAQDRIVPVIFVDLWCLQFFWIFLLFLILIRFFFCRFWSVLTILLMSVRFREKALALEGAAQDGLLSLLIAKNIPIFWSHIF